MWHWIFQKHTSQSFQPVILVTGCASGIGLAVADLLYTQNQYRVVVTARENSLQGLKNRFQESSRFWVRALDVTNVQQQESLLAEIKTHWAGVNVLLNNAGITYRSVLEHMNEAEEYQQMATNYLAPVALIKRVMPHMREIGRGKIINISSVSGMLAMPTMSSYSASKYALEGMSEALWYEARPMGINVCLIQPGFVRSTSFMNVRLSERAKKAQEADDVYSDYYANMSPFIAKLMRLSLTSPQAIARLALRVIQSANPPLWIPATTDAILFYYLRRWVPRRLLLPILFWALPNARKWGAKHTHRRRR